MVLAVIPCLNEEKYLAKTVSWLLAEKTKEPLRIVIVDGGSNDRSVEIAKAFKEKNSNVKFLANPKRIQSAALNLAASQFGDAEDWLLRIDAHSDYPAGFCQTLLDEAQRTGADSITVAMHTAGSQGFQRAVALAQNSPLGNGGAAHRLVSGEGKWVDHAHHALMRLAAFRNVGGYDETFTHNEDAELDIRLTKAGYKIWLTGKTAMTYFPRSTASKLFRQYYGFGRGRAFNILKHRITPRLRQIVPTLVAPAVIVAALLEPFAPFAPFAALPAMIWVGLIILAGTTIELKAGMQGLPKVWLAALIMHFAWSVGFWSAFILPKRQTGTQPPSYAQ